MDENEKKAKEDRRKKRKEYVEKIKAGSVTSCAPSRNRETGVPSSST